MSSNLMATMEGRVMFLASKTSPWPPFPRGLVSIQRAFINSPFLRGEFRVRLEINCEGILLLRVKAAGGGVGKLKGVLLFECIWKCRIDNGLDMVWYISLGEKNKFGDGMYVCESH